MMLSGNIPGHRTGRALMLASAGLIAIATSAPAFAQDTTQPTGQAPGCADANNDGNCDTTVTTDGASSQLPGSETVGDAIVVTGTRIAGVNQFNSPDPISIVSPDIAMKEGKTDLAEALQSSPIAAGSTQITAALSSNFVTNGGPGAQTIDLRGLGPNRTLVLLNGRRAGPAGTRGGVSSFDLNVLPLSLIQDIQILKTGASSIYGSDAIAGVVNIITKKEIDGFNVAFNSSVPFDSGGETYRVSATWGKTFDRGHFLIAADYSHTAELARGDRSYLACPEAYIFDQSGNRSDLVDPRTGKYHCEDLRWGHIWTYNLIDNLHLDGSGGPNTGTNTSVGGRSVLLQYQYPNGPGSGTLGIPAYGTPAYAGDFGAPAGWYPTGYDAASMAVQNAYHPFVEEQTIIPETDLFTVYAQGSYEISDAAELFGEFLFNRRHTYQNGWRQFWNFGYTGDLYGTGAGNAYNYWGGGFSGINFISPTAITNHADSSQLVDYYRGVGGIRGNLGGVGNWHYEAYGQYSRSIGRYRQEQILLDAYNSGYFQFSSCAGTTLPVSGKQCIDIPWADPYFLRGDLTPEQVNFLFDWEEGRTVYTQLTGEATLTGDLFQLPAGPLGVAIGITARRDAINDTPGAITLAGNVWGSSTGGITAGHSWTKEAFGELNIPVLKDVPLIKEFTLSAAARLTSVTATRASDGVSASDNGNWTYKIGANWAVTDWLRFRGSYGTSFRAPALFELFLADQTGFGSQRVDVCSGYVGALAAGSISQRVADNCAADGIPATYVAGTISPTLLSSGGLGVVESEKSKAKSVGAVLTPPSFAGTRFRLAVDYFDIEVTGEISQIGASNIVFLCYDSENFSTEPLCNLITRNRNASSSTAYQITQIVDPYINISTQKNTGLDVSARLSHDLGRLGTFSLTADMTWQFKDDVLLLPTSPLTSNNGEAGSPRWVGDFRATWELPSDFSVFYGVNVIGGTSDQQDFEDRYGGPCITSTNPNDGNPLPIYGTYCPDLRASPVFYHNISMTKDIADGNYSITVGINNLFDTRPPRVSVLNGGQISMLGPVISASQYSFVGRRAFINVSAKF
ncbi:MAG: TonB-dependent receptor [Sphingomonadaceae bacterium]